MSRDSNTMIDFEFIKAAYKDKVIDCPSFCIGNLCRLVISGSRSYGANSENSDYDIKGFCIPPKEYIQTDKIQGYDNIERFDQYLKHHLEYKGIKFDITIFNIAKFFKLAQDGNPNIIDILYSTDVIYSNRFGDLVNSERHKFLSMDFYSRTRGFVNNHIKDVEKSLSKICFTYNYKAAYHIIRAYLELIEAMEFGNINLKSNANILKEIKNGEWPYQRYQIYVEQLEEIVESLKENTVLPQTVNKNDIRNLLKHILMTYYMSISID